jgi:phage terminase large subunit
VRELTAKPYAYAGHIVPHDAQARELGTGKSRLEVLASLGLKGIRPAPRHRVEDGIHAVRLFLPRCWFDAQRCARGIEALRLYRADYDERLAVLRPHPVHDWCSHAADAFRYLAMSLDRSGATGFHRPLDYPSFSAV